jgi:hypothetical protein
MITWATAWRSAPVAQRNGERVDAPAASRVPVLASLLLLFGGEGHKPKAPGHLTIFVGSIFDSFIKYLKFIDQQFTELCIAVTFR